MYTAQLARLRCRLRDFLVYGELLDYNVLGNVKLVSTIVKSGNETSSFNTQAIHSALWRNRTGDLAVVMTNLSDETQTSELKLDLRRYGIKTSPVQRLEMNAERTTSPITVSGPFVSERLVLSPRSARAILFIRETNHY